MTEPAPPKIALLLMAAGSSSRLGQPKQLVEINTTIGDEYQEKTQSLLTRQISLAAGMSAKFNTKCYCVLGYQSAVMTKHLASHPEARNLKIIQSDHWSKGLSSSIASGIVELDNDVSAVLIFLVDQWQLTVENLQTLIGQWRKAPEKIHMVSDGESYAPPAIFPHKYFKELMALSGDEGAKKVIKDNWSQVKSVFMPAAFADVDTPEQLSNIKNKGLNIE